MFGFAPGEIAFVVVLLVIVVLAQIVPGIGEAVATRGADKRDDAAPRK